MQVCLFVCKGLSAPAQAAAPAGGPIAVAEALRLYHIWEKSRSLGEKLNQVLVCSYVSLLGVHSLWLRRLDYGTFKRKTNVLACDYVSLIARGCVHLHRQLRLLVVQSLWLRLLDYGTLERKADALACDYVPLIARGCLHLAGGPIAVAEAVGLRHIWEESRSFGMQVCCQYCELREG